MFRFGEKRRLAAEEERSREEAVKYEVLQSTDRRKFQGQLYHRLVKAQIPWGYIVERLYLQEGGNEQADSTDDDHMRKVLLYSEGNESRATEPYRNRNFHIYGSKELAKTAADEYWKEALAREAKQYEQKGVKPK